MTINSSEQQGLCFFRSSFFLFFFFNIKNCFNIIIGLSRSTLTFSLIVSLMYIRTKVMCLILLALVINLLIHSLTLLF
ncbi:hypothetical protein WN944_004231 [Citrus x changshan-huyou]|uniref:Uncharacterized protein n=1 Tax=Citrus x changshan-huyou TaxID=2935761 RepID=A0AAP0M4N8_9ROSI